MSEKINIPEQEAKAGRSFKNADDLLAYINGENSDTDREDVQSYATLGGEYQIEGLRVPALTPGMFPLLEIVRSPFVTMSSDDEWTRKDIIYALFVIIHGVDSIKPLVGATQRRRSIETYKDQAMSDPEMFKVYLDKVDQINLGQSEFEESALRWWTGLNIENWLEVESTVVMMFEDLYETMAALSANDKEGGDVKKKNGSELNG